jgi:membrane-bound inhibitor of C-type lysozyme
MAIIALAFVPQPVFAADKQHADPHADYVCEDGTRFSVRFADETAFVRLTDGTKLELPQQRSGSGFWYSSGRYELRGKGNDAMWTVGRKVPVNCTAST